jgi:uncharacterized protein YndB with AHSA1/START domain
MTDSTLLARWLMDNDMKPQVGHRFTFHQPAMAGWDGVVRCEVQELEPLKRIRYTWQSSGFSTLDTVVTWSLDGTPDGGTRLTLEHTGFLAQNRREAAGARQGWGPRVEKLMRLLAETVGAG